MAEMEGGAPAGFCTGALGAAGFAVAGAAADFAVAVAGFAAGTAGFAIGAAVAGFAVGAATGVAGLAAGAAVGRCAEALFCVAESGTSGGTGACFLVKRASLSSKSIKMFLRSKLRSALGTRRTCLFSAVLGKIGSTAVSRLSAAFGVGVDLVSGTGVGVVGCAEGYTLGSHRLAPINR